MDVSTLTRPTKYTPRFAGNDKDPEPFTLSLKPMVREYQLQSMEVHAEIEEHRAAEDASPGERAAATRANAERNDEFVALVLGVHVVGFDNLTNDGNEMALPDVLALLAEYPRLGEEVFSAIVKGGTMTEDDRKNSE